MGLARVTVKNKNLGISTCKPTRAKDDDEFLTCVRLIGSRISLWVFILRDTLASGCCNFTDVLKSGTFF